MVYLTLLAYGYFKKRQRESEVRSSHRDGYENSTKKKRKFSKDQSIEKHTEEERRKKSVTESISAREDRMDDVSQNRSIVNDKTESKEKVSELSQDHGKGYIQSERLNHVHDDDIFKTTYDANKTKEKEKRKGSLMFKIIQRIDDRKETESGSNKLYDSLTSGIKKKLVDGKQTTLQKSVTVAKSFLEADGKHARISKLPQVRQEESSEAHVQDDRNDNENKTKSSKEGTMKTHYEEPKIKNYSNPHALVLYSSDDEEDDNQSISIGKGQKRQLEDSDFSMPKKVPNFGQTFSSALPKNPTINSLDKETTEIEEENKKEMSKEAQKDIDAIPVNDSHADMSGKTKMNNKTPFKQVEMKKPLGIKFNISGAKNASKSNKIATTKTTMNPSSAALNLLTPQPPNENMDDLLENFNSESNKPSCEDPAGLAQIPLPEDDRKPWVAPDPDLTKEKDISDAFNYPVAPSNIVNSIELPINFPPPEVPPHIPPSIHHEVVHGGPPLEVVSDGPPLEVVSDGPPRRVVSDGPPHEVVPDGPPPCRVVPGGSLHGVIPVGPPRGVIPCRPPHMAVPDGLPCGIVPGGPPHGVFTGVPPHGIPPRMPPLNVAPPSVSKYGVSSIPVRSMQECHPVPVDNGLTNIYPRHQSSGNCQNLSKYRSQTQSGSLTSLLALSMKTSAYEPTDPLHHDQQSNLNAHDKSTFKESNKTRHENKGADHCSEDQTSVRNNGRTSNRNKSNSNSAQEDFGGKSVDLPCAISERKSNPEEKDAIMEERRTGVDSSGKVNVTRANSMFAFKAFLMQASSDMDSKDSTSTSASATNRPVLSSRIGDVKNKAESDKNGQGQSNDQQKCNGPQEKHNSSQSTSSLKKDINNGDYPEKINVTIANSMFAFKSYLMQVDSKMPSQAICTAAQPRFSQELENENSLLASGTNNKQMKGAQSNVSQNLESSSKPNIHRDIQADQGLGFDPKSKNRQNIQSQDNTPSHGKKKMTLSTSNTEKVYVDKKAIPSLLDLKLTSSKFSTSNAEKACSDSKKTIPSLLDLKLTSCKTAKHAMDKRNPTNSLESALKLTTAVSQMVDHEKSQQTGNDQLEVVHKQKQNDTLSSEAADQKQNKVDEHPQIVEKKDLESIYLQAPNNQTSSNCSDKESSTSHSYHSSKEEVHTKIISSEQNPSDDQTSNAKLKIVNNTSGNDVRKEMADFAGDNNSTRSSPMQRKQNPKNAKVGASTKIYEQRSNHTVSLHNQSSPIASKSSIPITTVSGSKTHKTQTTQQTNSTNQMSRGPSSESREKKSVWGKYSGKFSAYGYNF